MTFQKIKVILFDVGGTLIYTIKPFLAAISTTFRQNKIKAPNSEEIITQLGKSATKIIKAILPKDLSNFEEQANELVASFQEIFRERGKHDPAINEILWYLLIHFLWHEQIRFFRPIETQRDLFDCSLS